MVFEHRETVSPTSACTIAPATLENVADVLHFETPFLLELYKEFLNRGDRGYLAYLEGRCVHRSWVQLGPQRVTLFRRLRRDLAAGEAYIHYCETAPEARGQNVYPAVLAHITRELGATHRVLIATVLQNAASVRGILKAGFVEQERIRLLVLLGWSLRVG